MKKFIKLTTIIVSSLLLLVGCSSKKPGEEVMAFFDDLTFNEDIACKESSKEAMDLFLSKIDGVEVLSESINENGDSAVVDVGLYGLNLREVCEAYLSDSMLKGFANIFTGNKSNDEQRANIFINNINKFITEHREGCIVLNKVDNQWQIEKDFNYYSLLYGVDNMSDLQECFLLLQ